VENVELIPVLDDFLQVFVHSAEDRPQRLQFFIPQEMVVSWSALWQSGVHMPPRLRMSDAGIVELAVAFAVCFRWRHKKENCFLSLHRSM
jgi:hypothetical protein